MALKPVILFPGHEGSRRDARFVGDRLHEEVHADWDATVAASRNAAEMKAKVLAQYPGLGMEFTLNDRVAAYFPAARQ